MEPKTILNFWLAKSFLLELDSFLMFPDLSGRRTTTPNAVPGFYEFIQVLKWRVSCSKLAANAISKVFNWVQVTVCQTCS